MSRINGQQFLKLSADAHAFAQTVWLIEEEISRLGVTGADDTRLGSEGWRSHDVWEALKTASHFNLGIALELRLKCLLALQEGSRIGHHLTFLYDALDRRVQSRLEGCFRDTWGARGCTLVAYAKMRGPGHAFAMTSSPTSRTTTCVSVSPRHDPRRHRLTERIPQSPFRRSHRSFIAHAIVRIIARRGTSRVHTWAATRLNNPGAKRGPRRSASSVRSATLSGVIIAGASRLKARA